MGCGCSAAPVSGLGIVALRGLGDDAAATDPVVAPRMSPLTIGIWAASLATIGYIFYATLQPPKRGRRA